MNIGIDAYPLVKKPKSGIGYFTENLLCSLLQMDKVNQYILYNTLGARINLSFPNLRTAQPSGSNFTNKFSTLWTLFAARKQLIKDKVDIFWGTQGAMLPSLPGNIKTVFTVYDLTFYLYPETMSVDHYLVQKIFFKKAVLNSDKIISISQSTADDLQKFFPNKKIMDKIHIIYGSTGDNLKTVDRCSAEKYISNFFNIEKKFILFIGTIEPRKNIEGLLKAFKVLRVKYNISHELILAGAKGWKTKNIYKVYNSLGFSKSEVKFLGYVSEENLLNLYCAADLLVMPSFYEGFGLPPLEAMSCGVPVVASNISIFKEVLSDAALLADPEDSSDIAEKIYSIITNEVLRSSLINKGYERAKMFSWRRSAGQLKYIFDKTSS